MRILKPACFILWSLLNLGAASFAALCTFLFMTLRYDEMNTLSTARDINPHLTREVVVHNVVVQTMQWGVPILLAGAFLWASNCRISTEKSPYRKAGFAVAFICSFVLVSGVVVTDYGCLAKYPQHVQQGRKRHEAG